MMYFVLASDASQYVDGHLAHVMVSICFIVVVLSTLIHLIYLQEFIKKDPAFFRIPTLAITDSEAYKHLTTCVSKALSKCHSFVQDKVRSWPKLFSLNNSRYTD